MPVSKARFPMSSLLSVDRVARPGVLDSLRQGRLLPDSLMARIYGEGMAMPAFPVADTGSDGRIRPRVWRHRLHDVRDLGRHWAVTIVSVPKDEPDYRVRVLLVRKSDSLVSDGADLLQVWTDGGYADARFAFVPEGILATRTQRWMQDDTVRTDSVTALWSIDPSGRWRRLVKDSVFVPGIPGALFLTDRSVECAVEMPDAPPESLYRDGTEAVMNDVFGVPGTIEGKTVHVHAHSRRILGMEQRFSYGVFQSEDGNGGMPFDTGIAPLRSPWVRLPRRSARSWESATRDAPGCGKPRVPSALADSARRRSVAAGLGDWSLELCSIELRVLLSGPDTSVFTFHYRYGD